MSMIFVDVVLGANRSQSCCSLLFGHCNLIIACLGGGGGGVRDFEDPSCGFLWEV